MANARSRLPAALRAALPLGGAVVLLTGAFAAGVLSERRRAEARSEWSDARLLSQAIDSVRANALDSLPSDELIRRAVSGMLRELQDPYAALLRPDGYERYRGRSSARASVSASPCAGSATRTRRRRRGASP